MVLTSLVETWFAHGKHRKRQHGQQCCAQPQRLRGDMYRWYSPEPDLPPSDSENVRSGAQHDRGRTEGDADEEEESWTADHAEEGSSRYPAVGRPGAGDLGDGGHQLIRTTRFSRSSSSLEHISEEEEIGRDVYRELTNTSPCSTGIRRARYIHSALYNVTSLYRAATCEAFRSTVRRAKNLWKRTHSALHRSNLFVTNTID